MTRGSGTLAEWPGFHKMPRDELHFLWANPSHLLGHLPMPHSQEGKPVHGLWAAEEDGDAQVTLDFR